MEFSRLKVPNSRFALHGLAPPSFHGLCAFFAPNSRFMRLFQAALDTCLDNPFFASLSVHGLHFTVYAPSSILSTFPTVFVSAFSAFSAFLLRGVSSDPCFQGERGLPHFPHFPCIRFESLISKIRPTGFIMTGLR